jgi:hypothetical protein
LGGVGRGEGQSFADTSTRIEIEYARPPSMDGYTASHRAVRLLPGENLARRNTKYRSTKSKFPARMFLYGLHIDSGSLAASGSESTAADGLIYALTQCEIDRLHAGLEDYRAGQV